MLSIVISALLIQISTTSGTPTVVLKFAPKHHDEIEYFQVPSFLGKLDQSITVLDEISVCIRFKFDLNLFQVFFNSGAKSRLLKLTFRPLGSGILFFSLNKWIHTLVFPESMAVVPQKWYHLCISSNKGEDCVPVCTNSKLKNK